MQYGTLADVIADIEAHPLERNGHVYHPLPFPECQHLKASSDAREAERKWQLVRQAIASLLPTGLEGRNFLDIGANIGAYAFRLAAEKAQVTAFEPNPRYAAIGSTIAREKQLSVKWHPVPFDSALVQGETFDAALLLSVFQWMAEGGRRMQEAARQLRAVSRCSRAMVFELGYNSGKSCLMTHRRNHYAELIRLLREHTDYCSFRRLGTTTLWRSCRRYLVLCSHERQFDDGIWQKLVRNVRV